MTNGGFLSGQLCIKETIERVFADAKISTQRAIRTIETWPPLRDGADLNMLQ